MMIAFKILELVFISEYFSLVFKWYMKALFSFFYNLFQYIY